jgi:hypothetical protein
MRSSLFPILALAGLTACSFSASAQTVTRDYPLSGFDRIDLSAAGDVAVTAGPRFSVHAEGDAESIAQLLPEVRGNTLVLGWKKGSHWSHGQRKLKIAVTMPTVAGAAVSGAGDMTIDRGIVPAFDARVSGSGQLTIARLETQTATMTLSGPGELTAAGRADHVNAVVSGVGSLEIQKLMVRDGTMRMSGTGSIDAHATGAIDATVSGIGSIDIAGGAHCTIHKSGLGDVSCK